jgi:anaerobic magnesium-protoporphyrin IX monomethyl ester cyclase
MLLNMPNPTGRNVYRSYAGDFGLAATTPDDETPLPIYLLYAASAAKGLACEYDVLDAQVLRLDASRVLDAVRKSSPDLVISWVSLPSIHEDLALLSEIKRAIPGAIVIALGAMCNVMPEEVLLKSGIDLAVGGWYPHCNLVSNAVQVLSSNPRGQDAFDKIGGATYTRDGRVVKSPVAPCDEDLDHLSLDVYRQLPVRKYLGKVPDIKGSTIECVSVVTGAGCPYACMYCPYPIGYGRKVMHKSIPLIIDELEFLKANFGVTGFLFEDELFTHDVKRTEDLCDEMIRRDLNVKWYVQARVDEVNDGLLAKMKRAGCFRIHYGVETGSPEMLRRTGKPGLETHRVKKVFEMTRGLGLATTAHMMLGLPGENRETLENSFDLLCQINPDHANLNLTTPYPGTKLFRLADEKRWISTHDWSKYTSYDAVMRTDDLTAAELSEAREAMRTRFRRFKLRHDSDYRKRFLRALPKAILGRLSSLFGRLRQLLQHKRREC